MEKIETILFDLGGVLIDWDPRHLFKNIFIDLEEMEYFLNKVANSDWNEEQDAGRSFEEGIDLLIKDHPDYEREIKAYYYRWPEMLNGPIEGTLDILRILKKERKYSLYALTNWSAQTFPYARENFKFLNWFEDILVSGDEGMKKPSPEIYELTASRFNLNPATTLFIDDSLRNVNAAIACGFQAVQFETPELLKSYLQDLDIL